MEEIKIEKLEFYILKILKQLKTEEEIYSYFERYIYGVFTKKNISNLDLKAFDYKKNISNAIILWKLLYLSLCKNDVDMSSVLKYLKSYKKAEKISLL
ncbi:hypothetical protein MKD34_13890 (plasmid) [Cetobacterium somerae]|uniref:hypothetical protein n=1 Tax=Cetobacterium somerae TaxID=188913 RepID=UPI001F059006|nr:hypothetical protein [Cetobacterium somerae]UPO99053.1 hypothetical protein MKD34_13890 [Cetobacterium somerae]